MPAVTSPLPDLVLYSRPGCHLCDETRAILRALLRERARAGAAVPSLVERDIDADDDLARRYLDRIPVVELGTERFELAVSGAGLRRFLDRTLAGARVTTTS
jgi:hypothetical protein